MNSTAPLIPCGCKKKRDGNKTGCLDVPFFLDKIKIFVCFYYFACQELWRGKRPWVVVSMFSLYSFFYLFHETFDVTTGIASLVLRSRSFFYSCRSLYTQDVQCLLIMVDLRVPVFFFYINWVWGGQDCIAF